MTAAQLHGAELRSLAVRMPATVRTNDFYRERYPDVVAAAEKKSLARIWSDSGTQDAFTAEMTPYLSDAFRGTVARRVLAPGETALSLESSAARSALEAAGLGPGDVDALIACSFLPDQIGVGNAAYLARELGLECGAWNLEATCSGALIALHTASALVRAGEHRNVLVVVSCTYSRVADDSDTLSWFLGDGAGAFVVSRSTPGRGVLAAYTAHTAETCGTFYYDLAVDPSPRIQMKCTPRTGDLIRVSSERFVRECCQGVVDAAGLALGDVDCFVFNTPTAWYARFCARALGVDPARAVDTYPRYANVGPALMPVNLYTAAREGRLRPGDRVLVYTIGSVSSASALVMRWGDDVRLGPPPV